MSLKLGLYIIAALFVVALFGKTYQAGGDAREAKVVAKYQSLVDLEKDRVKQAEHDARDISEAKENERLQQTSELQARIDSLLSRPSAGIRLCKPIAAAVSTPGIPEASTGSNAATEGDGSSVRAGQDIERELVLYAQRCESDRQQVIGLETWIGEQAARFNR